MLASIVLFLGVGAGAFGAHGLRRYFEQYPTYAATYETAVRYHLLHGLGLLAIAWAAERWPGLWTTWAGYGIVLGVILFSGSLYALVFTRWRWLGAITPLGGVAFLLGWLFLLVAAWQNK